MTIKERRRYFDDKENWKVDDDSLFGTYGIRINWLEFKDHEIYEEENKQMVYDFAAGKNVPKMCHSCYFIIEGDGVMKKVGMAEIANLMKEWDREEKE